MNNKELNERLHQIFDICALHLMRMDFARSRVRPFLPLNSDNYYDLDDITIGLLDQFIFRFSKLQDIMGSRLFPSILELLAEPVAEKAFIDILNRLEKLEIIESALQWIELRKIRNDISHEYPASLTERIEGINILFDNMNILKHIIEKCKFVFKEYQ